MFPAKSTNKNAIAIARRFQKKKNELPLLGGKQQLAALALQSAHVSIVFLYQKFILRFPLMGIPEWMVYHGTSENNTDDFSRAPHGLETSICL